jgi:ComF family protein
VAEVLPQLVIFKRAALDLFFPQSCVGCGKEGDVLCRNCTKSFPRIVPPVCPKCGKPQPSGIICPKCVGWQNNIDGIRSPFKFEGVVREAIHQFKYKNIRCFTSPLAALLDEYLKKYPLSVQVIVPVPLHSKRLRERGYNQSDLLAHELSKLINLPVNINCLKRIKYHLPQARTKSLEERLNNVNQAFTCISTEMQKTNVLLIDDVSTSGATLDACAQALKMAGASSVWGLTLAREL